MAQTKKTESQQKMNQKDGRAEQAKTPKDEQKSSRSEKPSETHRTKQKK